MCRVWGLLLIAGTGVSASGFCSEAPYHYIPANSRLHGTIEQQTFPGRPNYESIARGDETEKGWFLRLNTPADVVTAPDTQDGNAETEKNVRIVQLTWDDDALDPIIRPGAVVEVTGKLFHRWNGHHHTRVLLDVSRAELAPPDHHGKAKERLG